MRPFNKCRCVGEFVCVFVKITLFAESAGYIGKFYYRIVYHQCYLYCISHMYSHMWTIELRFIAALKVNDSL